MLEERKSLVAAQALSSQGLWGLSEDSILSGWIHPSGFCFPEGLPGRIRSKCAGELVKECSSGVFPFRMGHIFMVTAADRLGTDRFVSSTSHLSHSLIS